MPRFIFRTSDGQFRPDHYGMELLDLDVARLAAQCFIGDMLREREAPLLEDDQCSVEVSNSSGLTLFVIHVLLTDAPAAKRGFLAYFDSRDHSIP